jgi:hypothetical protein
MELARVLRDSTVAFARKYPPTAAEKAMIATAPDAVTFMDRRYMEWADLPEPALDGLSPAEYLFEKATVEEWKRFFIDWAELEGGSPFPKPLRVAVQSRLAELGPILIELLDDEVLWNDHGPGTGFAPILAAKVAGELRYDPAVPPLLKVIERVDEFTVLGDAALFALVEVGEPAREGLYQLAERYKADVQGNPYMRAVEILTQMNRDERTWQYLKRGFQEATDMVGFYMVVAGDYGDQRAVFFLNTLLEERVDLNPQDRREGLTSIELLGGLPTDRARSAATMEVAKRNPFSGGKVGRNDLCPCGSGKKYKKCCGK